MVNTWDKAKYSSLSSGVVPEDFCASLNARPELSRNGSYLKVSANTFTCIFVVTVIVPPVYTDHAI